MPPHQPFHPLHFEDLRALFARTLVVGASVSDAIVDRNPTKRFLRRLGVLERSRTHAQDGALATRMLSTLKKSWLDECTAVIGIDLLFWDSVIGLGDPRAARAFLKGFFNELRSRKIPIVVGRIPGFHPLQIHRDELNEATHAEVRQSLESGHRAVVLPLDELFEQVSRDRGLEIDGKHHRLADLIPDGLHPGPIAAEYISKRLETTAHELLTISDEPDRRPKN